MLEYLNKVTVAEVTTKGKGYPTEVFIGQKATLLKPSFIQADNLHTVPKARLEKRLGTLDPETMLEVSQKIVLASGTGSLSPRNMIISSKTVRRMDYI